VIIFLWSFGFYSFEFSRGFLTSPWEQSASGTGWCEVLICDVLLLPVVWVTGTQAPLTISVATELSLTLKEWRDTKTYEKAIEPGQKLISILPLMKLDRGHV
jgi:hypothetical protein